MINAHTCSPAKSGAKQPAEDLDSVYCEDYRVDVAPKARTWMSWAWVDYSDEVNGVLGTDY